MSLISRLSNEAIAFQTKKDFFPRITTLFSEVIAHHGDQSLVDSVLHQIAEITKVETGIWLEPKIVRGLFSFLGYQVTAIVDDVTGFNPISQKALARMRKLDLSSMRVDDILEGTIDYKNSRVSGVFTTLRNKIEFDKGIIEGVLTGDELASVYLHEVGHVYTMMAFLGETLITNVVLAEVLGLYDPEASEDRKLLIGKCAMKLSGASEKDIDPSNMEEVTAVVLRGSTKRMQDRLKTRWYDRRLAERVADQFAARWMAGASLVKAIGKLERAKGVVFARSGYDPIWVGLVSNFFQLALTPWRAIHSDIPNAFVNVFLYNAAKHTVHSTMLMTLLDVLTGMDYPTPEQRTQAIRREIVTLLKNQKLDPEVRKQALDDLKIIDDEIAKVHNFGSLLNKFGDWVYATINQKNRQVNHQEVLEELANNRLYELNAYLKG